MTTNTEALAARLDTIADDPMWADHSEISKRTARASAAELRRLDHNNRVLTDALWKACGDDEATVNATIESQGELK